MSDEIKETQSFFYTPKDVVDVVSEFQKLFSKLESNIKHFIVSQPTFLIELRRKIKTEIGFLSPQKKDMALAIFGIIVTEDIIKKYDPIFFAEDISALMDATEKKTSCTDDEFIGLLTSFLNSLKTVTHSISIIINNFISLKSLDLEDKITKQILIQRHFSTALTEANLCFEVGEFKIDLRFIISIFAHIVEKLLEENEVIEKAKSAGMIYEGIIKIYPLKEGEDILYDIININIIESYYDLISQAFESKIQKRLEVAQEQQVEIQRELQRSSEQQTDQGRIEQILASIEQSLYEVMRIQREMTETKRQNLEKNIEKVMRRLAIEEFGVQDIADQQKYMQYILDTWFSIFEEYPQMCLPLIDVKQYTKFVSDPVAYIEENKQTIIQQLQFKIRRHTKGERFTPSNLAHAFSFIVYEIVTNPSVLSLTFDK
jgi:hypothetical protein